MALKLDSFAGGALGSTFGVAVARMEQSSAH